ncbi:MAG: lysozyme inhibitor LprI family protein [Xanthobacteraceae bacterium]
MRLGIAAALAVLFAWIMPGSSSAQTPKPTEKEVAAIRACATKYQDDLDKVEQQCLFNPVATPCTNKPSHASNAATADCYRTETAIWDDLLNENYKKLLGTLDDQQTEKLRAMQRAWIAYRDTTCNFYWDKIQGTMAGPMISACEARETARRAVLLQFFSTL